MAKISVALLAVILGRFKVQCHHLITLAGVFYGPCIGSLYSQAISATVQASGPLRGASPDVDIFLSIDTFDFKIGNAYNMSGEGHR